ncbi:MAG TPA: ATPase domain-containing protein [Candidatus Binatia bacterium]|nr:ATPase domain-containing protein [Candidatus Binatia bacterium]
MAQDEEHPGCGVNRVRTGIKGFDELVQGGIPLGSSVLVCGTPGTGKTIFALEFLYRGATEFKEKGLYVTFEQTVDALKQQAAMFGWNLDALLKKKQIEVWSIPVEDLDHTVGDTILGYVKTKGIKRLVVDSISTLAINAPIYQPVKDIALVDIMKQKSFFSPPILGDIIVRRYIYSLVNELQRLKHCTTLLISEGTNGGDYLTRDTVSEFACDGIVHLAFESVAAGHARNLTVRKMRETKNDLNTHPVEIGRSGIVVHSIVREYGEPDHQSTR